MWLSNHSMSSFLQDSHDPSRMFVFGFNGNGELTLGHKDSRVSEPQRVQTPLEFVSVSSHSYFGCALGVDIDGDVWGSGTMASSSSEEEEERTPGLWKKVPSFSNIVQISCGMSFVIARDRQGSVWSFGHGSDGELGLGGNTQSAPCATRISSFTQQASWISCGGKHTLILDSGGCVWSFGKGSEGELGMGNTQNVSTPTLVSHGRIPQGKISLIRAGGYFSVALDDRGCVWRCGSNSQGQLGISTRERKLTLFTRLERVPPFTSIEAGYHHCLALDHKRRLWSWGHNRKGQLGHSNTTDKMPQPLVLPGFEGIQHIAAGSHHSMFVDREGFLWVFGYNRNGELGLEDTHNHRPVRHPLFQSGQIQQENNKGSKIIRIKRAIQ